MKQKATIKTKMIIYWVMGFVAFFCLLLGIYFWVRKNNPQEELDDYPAIVEKNDYVNYHIEEKINYNYVVEKNDKYGVINEDGKIIIELEDQVSSYAGSNAKYLAKFDGDFTYIYDNQGNYLFRVIDEAYIVSDKITGEDYYYNQGKIYNFQEELVINSEFSEDLYDGYLFTKDKIISLKDQEVVSKIEEIIKSDKGIYGINLDEVYYYDMESRKLSKGEVINDFLVGYLVKINDEEIFVYKSGNVVKRNSEIKVAGYTLKYNCEIGFNIYDGDDNLISDICFTEYEVNPSQEKDLILFNYFESYVLKDKGVVDVGVNSNIQGDYILKWEGNRLKVYDLDNQEVEHTCYVDLTYVGEDTYICNDMAHSYFVDKDLKKISSEYEEITCFVGMKYCRYKLDGYYGLLDNRQVLLNNNYDNIIYQDKKIILNNLWGFTTLTIENTNNKDALDKESILEDNLKPYEEISIDEVIKDYQLEEIADVINQNKELFKKYAYIVLNNAKLTSYKKETLETFKVVANNLEYLEENYFLESLSKLAIKKVDDLGLGVAGMFKQDEMEIALSDDVFAIYHELVHFIDYNLNSYLKEDGVYLDEDKYVSPKEYEQLNYQEREDLVQIDFEEGNFLIEGGAEYFSSHYLIHNCLGTYKSQTTVVSALAYILGFDEVREMVFSKEGRYLFIKLMLDNGFSFEEINEFLSSTHRLQEPTNEEKVKVVDVLVTLYEKVVKKSWQDDEEFSFIIGMLVNSQIIKEDKIKNQDYIRAYQKISEYAKMLNKSLEQFDSIGTISAFMHDDTGSYIISEYAKRNGNYYNLVIKYDFAKQEILDYQVFLVHSRELVDNY